jgi:hypothetical protein
MKTRLRILTPAQAQESERRCSAPRFFSSWAILKTGLSWTSHSAPG